jgi:hypothetical protein
MDDALNRFVRSAAIPECRIISTPNLVFLCGGPTAAVGPEISARDHFHRYLIAKEPTIERRVKLAETLNSWFDHDTFGDLLELEEYLADISDLIVIFVESPGSIAELGAFAGSESLRPRTLAVLNSLYSTERSFILDGPVRRLGGQEGGMVHFYLWNADDLEDPENEIAFYDLDRDLCKVLRDREQSATKERKINLASHGHVMLLIADLVDMIGITSPREIIECLAQWNHIIDLKQLRKYLSLLEHLLLVKRVPNSNQLYYLSRRSYNFIKWASIGDRDRVKASIRDSLAKSDERRMRIFQQHRSKFSQRITLNV